MAKPTLATLSLVVETERAIAALDPPPHHAALVALARRYVAAISLGDLEALATFGPKLALVMTRLGATARPRTEPAALPAAAPTPAPAEASELDEMRERRERRAAARRSG